MKNKVPLSSLAKILSRGTTAILGGIALVSCGIQTGYTETDGIYYDPNTDKIEQKLAWQEPQEQKPVSGIIEQSQKTEQQQKEKYRQKGWGNEQKIAPSDWGNYVGTQHHYHYNTPSWGHSYYDSFYSPYYFGQYNSYFGNFYSWNMSYTWGNPWGHYRHYTPYHWGYNNYYHSPYYGYYGSYYSPYYGGYYGNYYHPYYGGYYGNYPRYEYHTRPQYKRSHMNTHDVSSYETPLYGTGYRTAPERPQHSQPTPNNVRVFRSETTPQHNSWGNASPSSSGNSLPETSRSGSNSGFRTGGFR